MLQIDKSFFESVVSSATESTGIVFDFITGYIKEATDEARQFLGEDLFQELSTEHFQDEPQYSLAHRVKYWICLSAYDKAIPHLDLVLTPTGFGVVSNQNEAPASADRVNRLIQTVKNAKEDAFELLLDQLRGNEKWCDLPNAQILFSSLFWRAKQLTRYGFASPHRSQLTEARPRINSAEVRLKEAISPEFYQELCDSVRRNNSTSWQNMAIACCLNVIGCELDNARREAMLHCRQLVQLLDSNIKEYPTYANSTAYAANNFKQYENAVNDSTYFFG